MSTLKIEIANNRTVFKPGEAVSGMAMWQCDKSPKAIEVKLFWYTEGKGTQDVCVAGEVRFEHPPPSDARSFTLATPMGPYSFSGKLISLIWAVELVEEPSNEAARQPIIVSPTGSEVLLSS